MGKYTQAASKQPAQIDELKERALVDLPTGPAEAAAPPARAAEATASTLEDLFAQSAPAPVAAAPEGLEEGVGEVVDQSVALGEEAQRQAVPSLIERGKGEGQPARWQPAPELQIKMPSSLVSGATSDGGLRMRSQNLYQAAQQGELFLNARLTKDFQGQLEAGATQPEIADTLAEAQGGTIRAALARVDAIEQTADGRFFPNEMYTRVASATTENMIMEAAAGETEADTDVIAQSLEGQDQDVIRKGDRKGVPVTKAQGNEQLGQQIHKEYQRTQGVAVPDSLPKEEALVIGDAFKELWAEKNKDLITRHTNPDSKQVEFQLTPKGVNVLKEGAETRKRLFPNVNVRPSKTPLVAGKLPGDVGANVVKDVAGRVGKQQFGGVIEAAMRNLAQVPNVVDKQRAKILFATALPVLRDGSHETWQAEINNMGDGKVKKFRAAKRDQDIRRAEKERQGKPFLETDYSPEENMQDLAQKIAQEVQAVARERNGANYLSYGVQAFNGRIAPQQSTFNPTSSKAVRFVTRNATPAIAKPGSRVDANLRQMYAMMLVPGIGKLPGFSSFKKTDLDLPTTREQKLLIATPKLREWGKKLAAALVMTDAEYEAIATAVTDGLALSDPNFPPIPELALDPNVDGDLINAIADKEEDGPHFIDGLIDFANYMDAKDAGRPYASYFNAYIDGKTNGLAANGIQMGHIKTAERTGTLRDSKKTLLDQGDPRDALEAIAIDYVDNQAFNSGTWPELASELDTVAKAVYSHRPLNKKTTMTFGYGKEIETFSKDVSETMTLLSETIPEGDPFHAAFETLLATADQALIAEELMGVYSAALTEVMSEDAIQSRELMRGAAMLHTVTNQLFKIKGYVGNDIHLGKSHATGERSNEIYYSLKKDGENVKASAGQFETEDTAAAPRQRTDDEGKVSTEYGGWAWGGSVPAPVQSLDAATVAMSSAGKSWNRMKAASGGNPYLHTIYDAFKMDANGYDVVLEEVNENWIKATSEWSYLQETYDATKKAMTEFAKEMSSRDPNGNIKPTEQEYMGWLFELGDTSNPNFKKLANFLPQMDKLFNTGKGGEAAWEWEREFLKELKTKAGFDPRRTTPDQITNRQYQEFVKILAGRINLGSRMSAMIEKTDKNKKALVQELKKRGHKTRNGKTISLQYYAH